MGKGKIGAQCAHAAVAVVERVADSQPHILDAWEENGQAKICLRADSTATLVRVFFWRRVRREVNGRRGVGENGSLRMLRLQIKVGHGPRDTKTSYNTPPTFYTIRQTKLARQAKKAGLPAYLVADAGRTQVAPGSKTVLAIGPGPKSALDAITGTLKLL